MLKDYLIKNGTILSLTDGVKKQTDIRVKDGIICEIKPGLEAQTQEEVIDASGMTITVGWVDVHCHFGVVKNEFGGGIGMNPYETMLTQGVTYALDPGTAGPGNFEDYRRDVRYRSDLRYSSFLNMGTWGINREKIRDTEGPQDVDPDLIRKVYKKYEKELCGLKIRIDTKFCFDSAYMLENTRKLADELGVNILVHAPRCDKPIEYVLSYLKKGDILTHIYAGHTPLMKVVDENGVLKPCVQEARDRGVLFDLGHGTNAFCYPVAEDSWNGGFFPDTISTDLWINNYNGPCYNMATVITKLRGVTGLPWSDLLKKVTVAPVTLYGIKDKALEIKEGDPADFVVFTIDTGKYEYKDAFGEPRIVNERLHVRYTCLKDKIYVNTRTDDVCEVE